MQSKAADVTTYIAEAPEDRRPVLEQMRALIRAELPDAEECIDYGMPCYKRDGAMAVAFASQKGYLAFYGLGKATLDRYAAQMGGLDCGKGCVRYKRPEQVNWICCG